MNSSKYETVVKRGKYQKVRTLDDPDLVIEHDVSTFIVKNNAHRFTMNDNIHHSKTSSMNNYELSAIYDKPESKRELDTMSLEHSQSNVGVRSTVTSAMRLNPDRLSKIP